MHLHSIKPGKCMEWFVQAYWMWSKTPRKCTKKAILKGNKRQHEKNKQWEDRRERLITQFIVKKIKY